MLENVDTCKKAAQQKALQMILATDHVCRRKSTHKKNSCRIFVQLWRIENKTYACNCNSLTFCVIQKRFFFCSQNVLKITEITLKKTMKPNSNF